MEIVFKRSGYNLEFLEKQLYEIFDHFDNCFFYAGNEKRFYEGGIMGFLKTDSINLIRDIWTPECTRKEDSYTISDRMMEIINKAKKRGCEICHFHSHLSDLPFPSPDDPYCVFDLIGIVSLGDNTYNDFRIFKQPSYCSYPPLMGNIKSNGKISTLVRFDKNKRKVLFLPSEDEIRIQVADAPFYRDW